MSFSRAQDRFAGPNSIYGNSDASSPSQRGRQPLMNHTPSNRPRLQRAQTLERASVTGNQYDDTLPLYMRPTASSAQKLHRNRPSGGRLQFAKGDGGDHLSALPKFGENAKGGRGIMERGKHGRFSMAGSYLLDKKGEGSDYCGIENTSTLNGPVGVVLGKSNSKRFSGVGSIFESAKQKSGESMLGHQDLEKNPGSGVSAAFAPGKLDKGQWLRSNTCMQDNDMSAAVENQDFANLKSDFDFNCDNASAVFRDMSKRFPEAKQDAGASFLGPAHPEYKPDPNCGVVYKKDRKHSRFSEFGGLHQDIAHKEMAKVTSEGEQFAARLLDTHPETILEEESR